MTKVTVEMQMITRQDVLDMIGEAIQDSLCAEWTSTTAAHRVIDRLEAERVLGFDGPEHYDAGGHEARLIGSQPLMTQEMIEMRRKWERLGSGSRTP